MVSINGVDGGNSPDGGKTQDGLGHNTIPGKGGIPTSAKLAVAVAAVAASAGWFAFGGGGGEGSVGHVALLMLDQSILRG